MFPNDKKVSFDWLCKFKASQYKNWKAEPATFTVIGDLVHVMAHHHEAQVDVWERFVATHPGKHVMIGAWEEEIANRVQAAYNQYVLDHDTHGPVPILLIDEWIARTFDQAEVSQRVTNELRIARQDLRLKQTELDNANRELDAAQAQAQQSMPAPTLMAEQIAAATA